MFETRKIASKARVFPAVLAIAGMALAIPTTGFAVDSLTGFDAGANAGMMPFTPANLDPDFAREVNARLGGEAFRFTPAANARPDRIVTMAIRVDDATARAISIRNALDAAQSQPGLGVSAAIEPTRYNLGIARGYQSFAQPAPKALALPSGIRDISMPDLADFKASARKDDKPSRFQADIDLQNLGDTGRAPRTLQGSGERTVDVKGSYRVVGNLNVTAGVRLSEEHDRLAPLTDGVEDEKAVYVGTQFKF